MVGRNVLVLQLVGECFLEKISDLYVLCIMYIPLCILLSLRYVFIMFLSVGYFLCMEHFLFLL
jgi:hypothetical protein